MILALVAQKLILGVVAIERLVSDHIAEHAASRQRFHDADLFATVKSRACNQLIDFCADSQLSGAGMAELYADFIRQTHAAHRVAIDHTRAAALHFDK